MDTQSEMLLKDCVRRILKHADLNIINKQKVLLLALENSGLDSNLPGYENVVKNGIDDFFSKNEQVPPRNMPTCVKMKDTGTSQEAETLTCSICMDVVLVQDGNRSITKLVCGHWFHFDCIASAFMAKGAMQCPNCRHVETGHWFTASE
ncbi:hypothetical protein MPTK1_1g23180 [Marchantia polymorpha subsp. ruderalis]|uniref:RING-type domain-containing protein n=2 Tax=Marchantia polymorpha TaxID=3197 RepID=A0AAF6ATD6_MARPO|nr:hypothetical protein MARPO_0065s0060 [Marchantia polymorpha]BBM99706.1 hypothetical protein Mp_1g23180 [Marchantia polymorpha subsp. ruderalis]|eukprot:PTQ36250.1 hypothetical protein MARPO_0065s0060 [Marchantia polymorpha]